METDAFFYRLFNQLPQTLFELLGLPASLAKAYRFDSVEVKKSLRIDGLFVPKKPRLPLYFVEVQFQRSPRFYANLFAKVFCYLEENDSMQEWVAVAIFPSRSEDIKHPGPYEDLLQSKRVRRIYLDELTFPDHLSAGLGVLKLVAVAPDEVKGLAQRLVVESGDSGERARMIELVEELLIRRFAELTREEIRTMFKLTDIRKTRVWQEAREEGKEEGKEEGIEEGKLEGSTETKKNWVKKWLRKGMTHKAIAELLDTSVEEVRRLAKA